MSTGNLAPSSFVNLPDHAVTDGVLDLVNNAQGYLRVLFKLYCLEGASANKGVR